MLNPLPSKELILSLSMDDEIVLLGQRMTARYHTISVIGSDEREERWHLDREKLEDERLRGDYGWVHARVHRHGFPGSIGVAAMTKEELADAVSQGNFYIG